MMPPPLGDAPIERFYYRLLLSPEPTRGPLDWYKQLQKSIQKENQTLPPEEQVYLPRDQRPERFLTYRRLLHANLHSAIRAVLPRTLKILDQHFEPLFLDWLVEAGPDSRLLREVAYVFCDYLTKRCSETSTWPNERLDSQLIRDLACYEAARVRVAAAPNPREKITELDLAKPVELHPGAEALAFSNEVHKIEIDCREIPSPKTTLLLLWRDQEYCVETALLKPSEFRLFKALKAKETLSKALAVVGSSSDPRLDDDYLKEQTLFLSSLAQRGVLRGAIEPKK
ncbi:MAG: hypothetical protein MK135_14740 [Polyangiaceae bacterium]|nr:hypothetical protein [Polyangiaceae bacterium]